MVRFFNNSEESSVMPPDIAAEVGAGDCEHADRRRQTCAAHARITTKTLLAVDSPWTICLRYIKPTKLMLSNNIVAKEIK